LHAERKCGRPPIPEDLDVEIDAIVGIDAPDHPLSRQRDAECAFVLLFENVFTGPLRHESRIGAS
jgi:hypothetical protein